MVTTWLNNEYTRNWNTGKYIGQWNDNKYSFSDGIESIWAFPLHDGNVFSSIYFPANLLLFWNIQIEYFVFVCPMMNVLNKMCVFWVCVDNQFDKTFENVCLWKSKSIITGVLHCAILAGCSLAEMQKWSILYKFWLMRKCIGCAVFSDLFAQNTQIVYAYRMYV